MSEKAEGQRMRGGKPVSCLTSQTPRMQLQQNGSFKVSGIQHMFVQIKLWIDKVHFNMKFGALHQRLPPSFHGKHTHMHTLVCTHTHTHHATA